MCKLTRIFFFTICLFTSQIYADVLKIRPDAPQEYVVKKGDTLWDISMLYLLSPWKWPQLWGMNPQIENPDLIYPGDTLSLVFNENGEPRLIVKSSKKIIKLLPSKRIDNKSYQAISTIPLHIIIPYLNYERALVEDEFDNAAIIIGGETNTKNKVAGDLIYGAGPLIKGHLYGIYRKVREYKGGFFNQVYAHELVLAGTARVTQAAETLEQQPAKLKVESSRIEIKSGDRLLSLLTDQTLPATFSLSVPENEITAEIISSSSKLREFSKLEVVVINAGTEQGLKTGHVLAVYRQSPDVLMSNGTPMYTEDAGRFAQFFNKFNPFKDYEMPYENIGKMVVFKTYDNLSYALITDTQKALTLGDRVGLPEL